jgi:protein TonB
MPEFPGGMGELLKYLSGNIRYPKKARKNDVEGKVIVQFVVSKTGKIVNVEVKRDPGGGC